jgi:hypothetical protein
MQDRRADPAEQVAGLGESALVEQVLTSENPAVSKAAIAELMRSRSPRRMSLLSEVVRDKGRHADVRAMAALNLGRDAKPANQEALLDAISGSPGLVRRRAIESLGKIGDAKALEQLRRLRPRDPVMKRSLNFARSIISYRLGLGTDLLEPPPALSLTSGQRVPSVDTAIPPVTTELLEETLAASREELPGLRLSSAGARQLACGANRFVLAFNREIHRRKTLSALAQRNAVLMVVLWKPSTLDDFETYMYILSHPERENRLRLLGLRSMGVITLSGEIDLRELSADFRITTTETPHQVPLELEGTYKHASQSIEFTRTVIDSNFPRNMKSSRTPQRSQTANN